MLVLLIDGYNVLFAHGVMQDIPAARERFVTEVESFCARTGQRAKIYFDSREGPLRGRRGHVEILYVAAGETADSAILRMVDGTADRTAFRVVSSDRAVAGAAQKAKMAVTSSKDFLQELGGGVTPERQPKAKEQGISEAEAKVWMREFGLQGGDHEAR